MNFGFLFGFFFLGVFIVFVGSLTLVIQRFHFLLCLLSLELIVLGLFVVLFSLFRGLGEGYLVFVVLSFASCEAAIGLSLLIRLVRSHGRDFISVLGVYEC